MLSIAIAGSAAAQPTPVGTWRSIDDDTGEAKSELVIADSDGGLRGRVEKLLRKDADAARRCTDCSDDRKDQPILGMEIIRGGRKAEGKNMWEGGKILDPENGKEYRAAYTPIDGGAQLQVRGYLGPFWRTQVWTRVK